MKVLIFMTHFYQLGGAERLAVELAEELNKRGIHADILSIKSRIRSEKQIPTIQRDLC